MSEVVIQVDNLSKQYRLGSIGTGSIVHDLNRRWHSLRGKPDPYLSVGETNNRTTKSIGEYVWSLRDLSFEVERGNVTGIIGRNGAGKSTLLKILSRTTTPTTGSVKIRGRVASLLEVGTGFHPELTGRENIFLNGAILGMSKREIRRKFDEIVSFSGVEKYVDTPVKRYSSGMYVRLAFSVAAHLESEILIVDEVLAVGDTEFQKKCLGRMKDVSREDGRTVLFVSHNMTAIENLCKSAIVLNEGKIHSEAPAADAIRDYLSLNQEASHSSTLENRIDRQGNGDLRFTGIRFFDLETKTELSAIASGQNVIMRLFFKRNTDQPKTKLSIGLGINDMLDARVAHLSNELVQFNADDAGKFQDHIDIVIKDLPFNNGIFNVTLYAAFDGVVADWIQNAFYFTVEGGDFYGSGKTIAANAGSFLLHYQFTY